MGGEAHTSVGPLAPHVQAKGGWVGGVTWAWVALVPAAPPRALPVWGLQAEHGMPSRHLVLELDGREVVWLLTGCQGMEAQYLATCQLPPLGKSWS